MVPVLGGSTDLAVVAIGGNVLAPPQRLPRWEEQVAAAKRVVPALLRLRDRGYRLLLTHGNGPQVGAILLQNEMADREVPANPLDVCVAQSQAQIGYGLQLALQEGLREAGADEGVMAFVSLVRVDPEDEAFRTPSKPIGPLYPGNQAIALRAKGWDMVQDSRGGFRRVVPSPRPVEVLGVNLLRSALLHEHAILIAMGGGGIPVVEGPEGLVGVEAVVDKDLASALLATRLEATLLVMVTDVEAVYRGFGTPEAKPLRELSVLEARRDLEAGEFPPGNMGPKIQAALDFLAGGGSRVVITDLPHLEEAMEGRGGTTLLPPGEP